MKRKLFIFHCLMLIMMVLSFINATAQSYFQQQVNYHIEVSLNDKRHTISAIEEIEYINNSSDTLHEIWIHLWPNAYKNNESALVKQQVEDGNLDLYFADEKERGFIDSLDFKVNGIKVKFEYSEID